MRHLRTILLLACVPLFSGSIIYHGPPVAAIPVTPPSWGGEITAARYATANATNATALTTNANVPAGSRIVLVVSWYLTTWTPTSVSDGTNTYTIETPYEWNTSHHICVIHSAPLAAQLNSGSTITITWTGTGTSYRIVMAGYIANSAAGAANIVANNTATLSSTLSVSGVTSIPNTVLVGCVVRTGDINYTPGTFTGIGAEQKYSTASEYIDYFQRQASTTGTYNPGGTFASNAAWGAMWVALP